MNGIKSKFSNENVLKILKNFDIACICETHFGIRSKSLDGFTLVARSKQIESKSPRGGVAVYRNNSCPVNVELFYDGLKDCVICKIMNTNVLLVAMYIPPTNSIYFEESYFENLDLIYNTFHSHSIFIMGDLNCRVGTPSHTEISYSQNPDTVVNTHGSKLKKWIGGTDLKILNGCTLDTRKLATNFTFFRGNSRSQNDLILSNDTDMVNSLDILEKGCYSDHCPLSLCVNVLPSCSLNFINDCAKGFLSDDHLDINKRRIPSLIFSKINWPEAVKELDEKSTLINEKLLDPTMSNDKMVALISTTIYNTCKENYKTTRDLELQLVPNQATCNSANFKAIAKMNFFTYNYHTDNRENYDVCKPYLEKYLLYERLANEAENKELNTKKNQAWKKARGGGKELWNLIDWKGKADSKKEILIQESDITPYFKKIFQSEKTIRHPKVETAAQQLEAHQKYVPELDDGLRYDELVEAVKHLGGGCGLDGLRSDIIRMVPPSLLKSILKTFDRIFHSDYPRQWEVQILNAVAKDGHSSKEPKLRGIGIAESLARLYDIILDKRFKKWYVPNREQAGFRPKQGPSLPLFSIFLLLHFANQNSKDLCVGFMDYEKAFDFANRAKLVLKLIDKGCGRTFTEAIFKMLHSTTYVPSTNNKLCEEISTAYGVAQGRNSSPDLYSFSVSDMPKCTESLDEKDFIDPHNLAQLADDTAMLSGGGLSLLGKKMMCLLDYSRDINQVPNIPKTVFCHFSAKPFTDTLFIDEDTVLSSVDLNKGHRYIGVKFLPTNNVNKIIKFNIDGRLHNWVKFYGWLQENEETPIEVKLLVLDACFFSTILYAVEVFGDITCVEKDLRLYEQKALRAILKVKQGTTIDLMYNELKRPDIISKIKDNQHKFYEKIKNLEDEEAVVKSILELCKDTPIVEYYESLEEGNKEENIRQREKRILQSSASMTSHYVSIVDIDLKSSIYSSFVDDRFRCVITRWRLSNHRLLIETGRYRVPKIERQHRKCYGCGVIEDERHAIYICPAFEDIRKNHLRLLEKYNSINRFLNPDPTDILEVADFLSEVDKVLNKR